MSRLMERSKRKIWIGATVILLLVSMLGCSLGDFLPAPTETVTPTPAPLAGRIAFPVVLDRRPIPSGAGTGYRSSQWST